MVTTAADGTATWTFSRPIVVAHGKRPVTAYMVDDTGLPVVVQVTSRAFTVSTDGLTDTHTSVTIKAQRSQMLPGVLVSLTTLLNFNIFGGAAVSGLSVNLWASEPTQ